MQLNKEKESHITRVVQITYFGIEMQFRSKIVARSQNDYFGKWLQVFFLKNNFYMQMNFWMNFFING
jgi:hypothetical protein